MSRHNRRAHAVHLRKVKPYIAELSKWVIEGGKAYPDPVDAATAYEKAGFGPPPVPWDVFKALIAPSRPQNQPIRLTTNDPRAGRT